MMATHTLYYGKGRDVRTVLGACRLAKCRYCAMFLTISLVVGCSRTPVDEIAEKLEEPDHQVRYDAVKELEDYGPGAIDAVPALADALSDPSPKVRYRSAKVLSKIGIGASSAAEQIAASLKDEATDAETRYYLVKTLANIEDSAIVALDALTEILQRDGDKKTRYYAAKALGKLGSDAQSAIDALESAKRDSDAKLRKAATEALAKVRPT